jgi:hypothetical protein
MHLATLASEAKVNWERNVNFESGKVAGSSKSVCASKTVVDGENMGARGNCGDFQTNY